MVLLVGTHTEHQVSPQGNCGSSCNCDGVLDSLLFYSRQLYVL